MSVRRRRPGLVVGLFLVVWGVVSACASGTTAPGAVHVLTWKGAVNPVMARYIDRGLDTAERSRALAAVIRLDTPGGLDSAMRDVIQRIESSTVPVVVFVSPAGGRAASAGTFITMAGHVAAMAPNTTIGAATPISSGGGDIEGALGRKVTNDAVAYIRGIAELRGRNADWAEQAVREAASVHQSEAVKLNVVDFVAIDMSDLLGKADGRTVQVVAEGGGLKSVTLRTEGAATHDNDMTLFENVLDFIATPDIAFLLLSLGGLAIITEIFHPSLIMGIFGVIALILAYFSLGALPTNWAGVALIVFAFILLGSEIFVSGFGVLGIGGVVSLILGGLILTSGSEAPGFQVSRWLIVGVAVPVGAFLLLVIGTLVRLRRMPPAPLDRPLGKKGVARTVLDPVGYVSVAGERWEAVAEDSPIEVGTVVIVTGADGLRLTVRRESAPVVLLTTPPLLPPAREQPEATGSQTGT